MSITDSSTQKNITKSEQLFAQAQHYMPGGVNSPVRAFKAVGGCPRFIARAQGALIVDADGNDYVDYVGSWGPMIAGHANPAVVKAVTEAAQNGLSFGAPCEAEVTLAKIICDLIPSIDKIRMVNSGTEATMTALRLARGATGRDKIIKFEGCYHGHSDMLLIKAGSGALTFGNPSSPGVPVHTVQDTLVAQYNDLDSVVALFEQYRDEIAAIIIEPIAGNMNMITPQPEFLAGLRDLCNEYQSILIFDEVMTGFRVALGGAQALYGITPDLTCFGKIIGGGMPVGAFGGRQDIMDQLSPLGPVYQAGTLSGNPIAMAAGIAMMELIQQEGFYQAIDAATFQWMDGLKLRAQAAKVPLFTRHIGSMFGVFFTDADSVDDFNAVTQCNLTQFNQFFQQMLANGVYLAPSAYEAGFVSSAHTSALIERSLLAAERSFATL